MCQSSCLFPRELGCVVEDAISCPSLVRKELNISRSRMLQRPGGSGRGQTFFFKFYSLEPLCVTLNNKALLRGELAPICCRLNQDLIHENQCLSFVTSVPLHMELWIWLWGTAELQRIWLQKDWTTFAVTLKKRSRHCMWVHVNLPCQHCSCSWQRLRGLWLPAQREMTSPRPWCLMYAEVSHQHSKAGLNFILSSGDPANFE